MLHMQETSVEISSTPLRQNSHAHFREFITQAKNIWPKNPYTESYDMEQHVIFDGGSEMDETY